MATPGKRSAEEPDQQTLKKSKQSDQSQGLNLAYPFDKITEFEATPPFIHVGQGLDISDLSLNMRIGKGLRFENGNLVVSDQQYNVTPPLIADQLTLGLKYNPDVLSLTHSGALTLPTIQHPLQASAGKFELALSSGLKSDDQGLTLNLDPVFSTESSKFLLNCSLPLDKSTDSLSLKFGNGLGLNNGQLENIMTYNLPLKRDGNNVSFSFGTNFKILNEMLDLNLVPPLSNSAGGLALQFKSPMSADDGILGIKTDTSLDIAGNKLGIRLAPNSGLQITPNGLAVSVNAVQILSSPLITTASIGPPTTMVTGTVSPGRATNGQFVTKTAKVLRYKFVRWDALLIIQFIDNIGVMENPTFYRNKNIELRSADFLSPTLNNTYIVPLNGGIRVESPTIPVQLEVILENNSSFIQVGFVRLTVKNGNPHMIIQCNPVPDNVKMIKIKSVMLFTCLIG